MASKVSVKINLNTMGYQGNKIRDIFNDTFPVNYPTQVVYEWQPSAIPPYTATIFIIFGMIVGNVTTGISK